jgi:hypothetical protein
MGGLPNSQTMGRLGPRASEAIHVITSFLSDFLSWRIAAGVGLTGPKTANSILFEGGFFAGVFFAGTAFFFTMAATLVHRKFFRKSKVEAG